MKKLKKNSKFTQLSADEMKKISGGVWIEVKDKDGKTILVEV